MIRITTDFNLGGLTAPLHAVPEKVDRLIAGVLIRQEGVSSAYMKSNAPWTDRTGNARQGLHAVYGKEGDAHTLTLAHGVSYGIWLEVRYAGRYAVILDSMQNSGSDVMRLLDKGLSRL